MQLNTHTHTHPEFSERGVSPSHRPLPA